MWVAGKHRKGLRVVRRVAAGEDTILAERDLFQTSKDARDPAIIVCLTTR